MARKIGLCDVATVGAGNGVLALTNAATVLEALTAPNDSRFVHLSSAVGGTALFEFKTTLLLARNPAKKQSRWLRCTLQVRNVGGAAPAVLSAVFQAGTHTFETALNLTRTTAAVTYTFLYPINASNGGTTYWDGVTIATPKLTLSMTGHTTFTTAQAVDVDYAAFDYGEADNYVDVYPTATVTQHLESGISGSSTLWTNPTLAIGSDTDGASYAGGAPGQMLDRQLPAFTMPVGAIYSGVEIWDAMVFATGGIVYNNVNNWPLLSPTNNTPQYRMQAAVAQYARPPISVTPPGGADSGSVMGYWVWGLGPDDNFNDASRGTLLNGWTGLTEANLTTAKYATMLAVSTAGIPAQARSIFWRVYYEQGAVGGTSASPPLLFCEA